MIGQATAPAPPASTGGGLGVPLTQVAFSVVDLASTERWFREGLGFWPAGGSRLMMRGPLASSVQGLPHVASTCWWMVDRNEFFQLELFQFERPVTRLMSHDSRPCDIGYARIGLWVDDFERTLARLFPGGRPPPGRGGPRPGGTPSMPPCGRSARPTRPRGTEPQARYSRASMASAWRSRSRRATASSK